jgi:hypothetical protein
MAAAVYEIWVFVHLLGVFGFLLAHGASAAVALRLRTEREPEHVRGLLDLSSGMMNVLYVSLLLLLAGGIGAAFDHRLWGRGWIWASLGLLVAVVLAMYVLASTYYGKVREAAGIQTYQQKRKGIPASPPASPEQLDALLSSARPLVVLAVGAVALGLILWLMVLKPF